MPDKQAHHRHLRRWAWCLGLAGVLGATGLAVHPAGAARPATTAISGGWSTYADRPTSVVRGATVAITAKVTSTTRRFALVDVEIIGPGGRVAQSSWDNRDFTANVTRGFKMSWAIPAGQAPGTYVVKIGMFGPGWAGLQHWNDHATAFTITTTTTQPPVTTVPPATARFKTLPVGAALPSDAQCAAAVRRVPEIRAANRSFNATRGTTTQTGYFARVTGNFTGTTDEIIQWAACKWGIDEDIVRAQTAKESWWFQRTGGDWSSDPALCASGHSIGSDGVAGQCPESIGLMQVRFQYWRAAFPSSTTSSAYNLDAALAGRRSCFEGRETWLGGSYAAGDIWGCVGLWFSGRWHDAAAETYTAAVKDYLDQRIWTTPNFISAT